MGLIIKNNDNEYIEDKRIEALKDLIAAGLKDMEEGRTLSLEDAFRDIEAN